MSLEVYNISPFVGRGFESPDLNLMRVMCVGINAYISDKDWPPEPEWCAEWFKNGKHRFYPATRRYATEIAEALLATPTYSDLQLTWPDSFYFTNAVKKYLRESEGKTSGSAKAHIGEAALALWYEELDALAQRRAFPHLIVILGEPFWAYATATFGENKVSSVRVAEHRHTGGPCLHYANLYVLDIGGDEHTLVLVRVRHPSGRGGRGLPSWLLAHDDFTRLLEQAQ